MQQDSSEHLDRLVERSRAGDEAAARELLPLVYDELRRIAGAYMRRERPGQTIQPTALVHEAYLRLLGGKQPDWEGRTHFLAIAACSMRQILVERARARQTDKRGGDRERVTLEEGALGGSGDAAADAGLEILAVDSALERLAALDERQARVVELRFFGGLTIEETAAALQVAPATVKRDWTVARAWLRREILGGGTGGDGAERGDGGDVEDGEPAEGSRGS